MTPTSSLYFVSLLLVSVFYGVCGQKSHVNAARLQTPIIASVAPNFGSVEGGTWITITGANFAQQGLFTNRAVFIAGQVCKEISYYTSNTQITCVVPRCVQPECLSSPTWGDSVRVSLDVYIQGVEGIKSASTTYQYHGSYTPMVLSMMRYVRNSAFFMLQGRTSNTQLSSMEVRIGDNLASFGEPGEVNPSSLNMWTLSQKLYYLPPNDVTGGYYNLTLNARYDSTVGYVGTGKARMFPRQRPFSGSSFFSRYNFDASWSGTVYSVAVQPVIYSVEPAVGSIVGGTTLTIIGAGFNLLKEMNQVLVGGYECAVQKVTASSITCITASISEEIRSSITSSHIAMTNAGKPSFAKEVLVNSTRDYGSPGWWIRTWSLADFYANNMRNENAQLSLGYRGDSVFSFYYMFSTTWEVSLGVDTPHFAAQYMTYLVAPVSGTYRFYLSSDDNGYLYCRLPGEKTEVTLFNNLPYTDMNNIYSSLSQRTSVAVVLDAGQRLRLRAMVLNVNTADYLSIGLRIDPSKPLAEIREVEIGDGAKQQVDLTSPTFLHHHALRDIQVVSLAINYKREIQTLVIANVESGTFRIILQNMVPTDVLSFASTSSEISNALYYASMDIPSASRLCSSFGVSRSFANSGTTMFIRVEFYCDNSQPLPQLYAYTADLVPKNNNLTTFTQVNQFHTPIPSGSFVLSVPLSEPAYQLSVPFDSSADNLRDLIQSLASDITVDVTRSGGTYSGLSWTVTFATPRGNVPHISVNTTGVSGSNVRGQVLHAQNGSIESLWFQSIPAWMTEVPLSWSTNRHVKSNVEVYVRQGTSVDDKDSADVSKAACDNFRAQDDYTLASFRQLFGDESGCGYDYSSNKTPIVSAYRKVHLDLVRSALEIWGSGFAPASLTNPRMQVTVSIARHACNVTFVNDTFIACQTSAVPYGRHQPVVNVEGLGNALLLPTDAMHFEQEIESVEPRTGSFAGGQVLTIRGRGFHWNATVSLRNSNGMQATCEVLQLSSSEIQCRTPSSPYVHTYRPSSLPSSTPSTMPSTKPSTKPSTRPSSAPSQPSSRPTAAPFKQTMEPTVSPTMVPTDEPTYSPSDTPTLEPTSMYDEDVFGVTPTYEPTVGVVNVGFVNPHVDVQDQRHVVDLDIMDFSVSLRDNDKAHRHLLTEDEEVNSHNTYQVFVDDMVGSDPFNSRFTYDQAYTPLVISVSPDRLSAAVSTNITITGLGLSSAHALSAITVSVGGQRCTGLVSTEPDVLRCLVVRSKTFGGNAEVAVQVSVDELGYAGLVNAPNTVPTLHRGFDFSLLTPINGSLLGGNTLVFEGHGFVDSNLDAHKVTLRQVDGTGYSEYDELLLALGFNATTQLSPQTQLNCEVLSVSESMLYCRLPDHDAIFTDAVYEISISANNVSAVCTNSCFYEQSIRSTPAVASNVSILQQSSKGEYLTSVVLSVPDYSLVTKSFVTVKVQKQECQILALSSTGNLTFVTPPLSFRRADIEVFVRGFGRAQSAAFIEPTTEMETVDFASNNGSVAGGTRLTISGQGFATDCKDNVLSMRVSIGGVESQVMANDFVSCSVTSLVLRTPSILSLLPASVMSSRYAGFVARVTGIAFSSSSELPEQVYFEHGFPAGQSPFAYTISASPILVMNVTSGFAGDAVLMTVTATNVQTQLSATIGGQVAPMLRLTGVSGQAQQSISSVVTVPQLSATSTGYDVLVEVAPFGFAISNSSQPVRLPRFRSKVQVDLFSSTVVSSVDGGLRIRVSGKGLSQPGIYLSLCRQNCTLVRSTYDDYVCETPARIPTDAFTSLATQGLERDSITDSLPGTYFSSLNNPTSATLKNAFDEDKATYFTHSRANCHVGIELPADMVAQPHRMLFYPRIAFANRIKTFVFEGRLAGSRTFSTLATGNGVREGWNFLQAQNGTDMWFNAFRYRAVDSVASSNCMLAEVFFSGKLAYNRSTCTATLFMPATGKNVALGNVEFSLSNTPVVRSISPDNGTALGGQFVTITGQNLDSVPGAFGQVSVSLSQVDCAIQSVSSTVLTCITGPRPPEKIDTSSIVVNVPGRGLAFVPDAVQYLYIDRWSALTTWKNQEPPVDGDVVWIPDGQVILLDEDTPLLTFLLIEGRLYFDRNQPSLHLDSHYVLILGGYMEVGTETEPFNNEAVLTLHGDRYTSIDIPMIGVKFICVAARGLPRLETNPGRHVPGRDNGQLEVHGKKRLRTWTHVAETIVAGDNFLITSEPVDFAPGEQVVITGSEVPQGSNNPDAYGLEVMTVLHTVGGYNVTFTTAFRFTHRSEIVFIEGRRIDLRMNVGLLTRNVKIQGDEEKSDGQLMGVHNMAVMSGIFRIENAEVRRCGQAFRFGRYCTHSHMAGNMEGSYVKANSIHNSYQRAVTTHDTSYWEVRDNVAYNVMGHAYFVEDGVEFHNAISGNLGVFILTSSALLHSDLEPSIFWTKGPFNMWRDNVAAHSAGNGFWFELGVEEDGYCLNHMGLQEFVNNTFHSNTVFGLKIYPEWTPLLDPCNDDSAPLHVYLYNMLSYRNAGNGMFSKKHGAIHHVSPTFVENPGGDVSIVKYPHNEYNNDPTFRQALFVGSIDPNFQESWAGSDYGIFSPQGEYFYVSNSTFVNYGTSGVLTGCNHCLSGDDMNQGGFTTRYDRLRFVRSKKRIFWSPTKKEILWDLDGSLAGVPDSMITMYYGHLNWPQDCTVLDPATFSNSIRCGGVGSSVRIRRMQIESVTPSQLSYTDLAIRSDVGKGSVYFLPLDTYGWVFPVVTGVNKTYELVWEAAGISAYTIRYELGRPEYLTETMSMPAVEDVVTMRYRPNKWDYDPYSFAVTYNNRRKVLSFNTTAPLTKKIANGKYINYTVDVVLSNVGTTATALPRFGVYMDAQLCPPKGCPVPPVPTIGTPMLWSKTSSWQNKRVPVGGQQVTIDSNMWIVMDISPPSLGCITIYGKLSFLSNATSPRSLTLRTSCMRVFGTFEIVGQDNGTFVGDATVILSGTKQNSLPITMTEGVFLGSKVIGVSGALRAIGTTKNITWTKLRSAASAGSSTVDLARTVDWMVGDNVVFSPTGYFTSSGRPWNNGGTAGSSDELRTILAVNTVIDSQGNPFSRMTLNKPLNHTHICKIVSGNTFCGAVGVMTRNVRFLSLDSQNPSTTSFGFGGHIHVFDIKNASPKRYGSINVTNVEFRNFGKINSDHYAIRIDHTDTLHTASAILNCSFTSGYSFALRTDSTIGTRFDNNVVIGNFGGGVYIDRLSQDFSVDNNLVIGTRQMPSVQSSSFPWLRPIAGFAIFSPRGVVTNNLAAGSHDQGFMVAMSLVTLPSAYQYLCTLTRSLAANIAVDDGFRNLRFFKNEAVAGRGGVQLVTMGPGENSGTDCAALDRAFAWRNAHTGVLALDVRPNIVVTNAVLAENHIGLVINIFKQTDDVYTGVLNSTIINSIERQGACADGADSVYLRGRHCAVFTEGDPSGASLGCGSIFNDIYRRVGLLLPMSTNRARTCAIERRFECDPPNTPDRLCLLPWEKRYALPNGIQYMEYHLHGNNFVGFESRSYNSSSTLAGQCIPSAFTDRSVAVAVNPSQVDYQPTIVTSRNSWIRVDVSARFGMDLGSYATLCQYQPCSGQQMLIVHDVDGTFGSANQKGQLVARNPELVDSFPSCVEVSNMALNLYFCPETGANSFQQYHGGWLDNLPQIIQPLTTTRTFPEFNRTVASYGPIDDMCAKRFYFSRFNFLYATNRVNTIQSTGTTPSTILLRWDAPDDSKSTIIHLIVEQSLKINVFVGESSQGPWIAMPQNVTYPLLTSPAGSSQRNPQQRYLAFTATGRRFYRLVMVPVAAVTVRMEMSIRQFYSDTFIANMAMLLQITASRIKVTSVREGSVITDFEVSPSSEVAATSSEISSQVDDLTAVTANLTLAIATDKISVALNATVLQVFATNPVVVPELNATLNIDTGSTNTTNFNISEYRASLIAASVPVTTTLLTFPTSMPSSQPSRQPTGHPSGQPSTEPSTQPSTQPTRQPTTQPSSSPTGQPSVKPTRQPTSQPSRQPSAQPTHPTSRPSSQPSRQPSRQPTGQPSRQPTSQPSRQPTRQPTGQPTKQPFSRPSGQPSRQPTGQPTRQPFSRPSGQPSTHPTCQPSRQPFLVPTGQPSRKPSRQPSRQPSTFPTSRPSRQPSSQPSCSPTTTPSSRPSSKPTHKPTPIPTAIPTTASPSAQPTYVPSADPTFAPSGPTQVPTRVPTAEPSVEPTYSPSVFPTYEPSHVPTEIPTYVPSATPTEEPTVAPTATPSTAAPSMEPTYVPSEIPTYTPSEVPSEEPTPIPTAIPSEEPTYVPSEIPTYTPSEVPSEEPTHIPTAIPSEEPTYVPSEIPTYTPSEVPSEEPTPIPTAIPSDEPTYVPSEIPTYNPSEVPSEEPTYIPTAVPSAEPTYSPSEEPSFTPSKNPSAEPTYTPTVIPSFDPSAVPTYVPTVDPSVVPTTNPTEIPAGTPTAIPSAIPTETPSFIPTEVPSEVPTAIPSIVPTDLPSYAPSEIPTLDPSAVPSVSPSETPSMEPTKQPSETPTMNPSTDPSFTPTESPSYVPSADPSAVPTEVPSYTPSANPSQIPSTDPTYASTADPSASPSRIPTVNPSVVPTVSPSATITRSPTGAIMKQISFEASQIIHGLPSLEDMSDPSTNAAVEHLLAQQLEDSSRSVSVTITGVSTASSSRRELSEVRSEEATVSVLVEYIVQVLIFSPEASASSDVYQAVVSVLNAYVSSGSFTAALQSSGLSAFFTASSQAIDVQQYFETELPAFPSPTSSPRAAKDSGLSPEDTVYVAVGSVIGGLALLALLFWLGLGYYRTHKGSPVMGKGKAKTVMIVPLQSDFTFVDIERLNTPDGAAAGVMRTSEGNAEVYVQRRASSTKNMREKKNKSKGRSFFDFGSDFAGVNGMFTHSKHYKDETVDVDNGDVDSEDSVDDYLDSADQPDREAQPHIEQTNPLRAAANNNGSSHKRRTSHSSQSSNDAVSGPLSNLPPIHKTDSSLFFQDDSSSVDSDQPIVLRQSAKQSSKPSTNPAFVLGSSSGRVGPHQPDTSDSDVSNTIRSRTVQQSQTQQSLASSSRDQEDWQVARVSERDRHGRF